MFIFWRGVQSKYKESIKSAVIGFQQHAQGSGVLERKTTTHYSTHTSSFKADCAAVIVIIHRTTHMLDVWIALSGLLYPLSKILKY